jgi:hypothetical protein
MYASTLPLHMLADLCCLPTGSSTHADMPSHKQWQGRQHTRRIGRTPDMLPAACCVGLGNEAGMGLGTALDMKPWSGGSDSTIG